MKEQFKKLRVGLMGLGLDTYWEQFAGLERRLLGYVGRVEAKIARESRSVFNFGLIDTAEKALEAGHACRRNDIDVLLLYVTTYALSSTVLPIILRAKVPVLLLNLQPEAMIDYVAFNQMMNRTTMTGEWLAYCSACPVPEIANVLKRLGIGFQQITGMLENDPECWQQIEEWLLAAEVCRALSHSRMGLMGHYYSGMLDIATDLTQVSGRFGIYIEMLEVDELSALRAEVREPAIKAKLEDFASFFEIGTDCSDAELDRAARTAVALDVLIKEKDLDLMAYYYKGSGVAENERTMSSIILGTSLLTGAGVPVAGEYEVKNVIAMKIMDLLGAGGSFTEYYAMDFAADVILMGHDGPGHVKISNGRIKVKPLEVYHGKVGSGLSVEMSVKQGPVTLLSIVEHAEKGFLLLAAQAESVAGPTLAIGNTNSRYKFPISARSFVEQWNGHGPAHHCAIGVGHLGGQLSKIAWLLDLGFKQVC